MQYQSKFQLRVTSHRNIAEYGPRKKNKKKEKAVDPSEVARCLQNSYLYTDSDRDNVKYLRLVTARDAFMTKLVSFFFFVFFHAVDGHTLQLGAGSVHKENSIMTNL